MRLTTVLLIVACLFAAMVMAGPNRGTVPYALIALEHLWALANMFLF